MSKARDYLITGIMGFAGPHLAKIILDEGHKVHGLVRGSNGRQCDLLDTLSKEEIGKIKFHHGDLKDYQSIRRIFEENKFDGVFHLGAQAHPPTGFINPVGTMQDNVMGTVNLVDNIQRVQPDCILQNTSTSEVYGNEGKEVGILREDLALRPNNPYGASKAMAELYVQERGKNGFLKGFSTRGFSHTGVRRGKNFSISWDAYHLALLKKGIPITDIEPVDGKKYNPFKSLPVGNLGTQRIVIDVRDCMRAYWELMQNYDESMGGEAYNVCGSMEDVKYMEYFTDTLIKASGLEGITKIPDKRVYRPIDIQMQVGDSTKLREKTGWKPQIDLEKETLPALLNYWENKIK